MYPPRPEGRGLAWSYQHLRHSYASWSVNFDIHMVTVKWDSQARHVETDAAETTLLVGMRLLVGHDLRVEVENGGRVVIEAR